MTVFVSEAQEKKPRDSAVLIGEDGLLVNQNNKKRLPKMLYNTLVVDRPTTEELGASEDIDYMNRFSGRRIRDVIISTANVADPDSRLWADRTLNSLHATTRGNVIRKDLLFSPGDTLDPVVMRNNRQLIRSRSYIADIDFDVVPSPEDSMVVDVYVRTRDKWTISVDIDSESNGETEFALFDNNIAGTGNRLRLGTYFNWKNFAYGGNKAEYFMPNMFGTFFSGRAVVGKGFDNSDYGLEVSKAFIRPKDFAGGIGYMMTDRKTYYYYRDSSFVVGYNMFDAWAGRSIPVTKHGSSLYFTGRYYTMDFTKRPENVTSTNNPYFYNDRMLLGSIGLYKERFRPAVNIYSYGIKEDMAYGYRTEFTGGYSWSEFGGRWYLGGSFNAGYFTKIGYLGWDFALGSYLNSKDGKFYRTSLVTNIRYFTRLMKSGRSQIRHFVNVNITRGWNRLDGFRETLAFVGDAELRGLRERNFGQNRFVVKNETVVFTPWNVYGFKFAMFGFVDMGLMGDYGDFFDNELFTTLGAGVRIKNESLIFSTITLRLGIALCGRGLIDANYFDLSNRERMMPLRYIPTKASPVDYR